MSGLSCTINKCNRISRALCHCCNQNICLLHLNEHYETFICQLNPLVDEINTLENRLIGIDMKLLMEKTRQEFDKYRYQYHQTIDEYFERKYQEFEENLKEKFQEQNKDINTIRISLKKFHDDQEISQKEIDFFKREIEEINKNLYHIEHQSIPINIHPLIIDNNLIEINEKKKDFLLPIKIMENLNMKSQVFASNNQLLLIHQQSSLSLIDQNFQIIKKLPWHFGSIRDICWLTPLNRFIIITESHGICFVQENTISFENEKIFEKEIFSSCTCSDTSLYLTCDNASSSIAEYRLLPSIKLIKQWKSPDICKKNESIICIRYDNEKFGLILRKYPEKTLTFELRSIYNFDRIWLIQLNPNSESYRCCILNDHDWLFTNTNSSHILHITKDGKMKKSFNYNNKIFDASLFGQNLLAILTENTINFHKL